ncbi:RNA-directed DNA polymerase, eukaryota, reverse transcriptase zinc-binding domain protein [Tanacetum coccineum]
MWALKPVTPNTVHEGAGTNMPSIILSQAKSNDFPVALLGCYRDFRAIANTRSMCRNEGFLNVDFKYLGGLWVLFDFESSDARDKFLNHKGILTWFSTLKPWYDDFVVDERLIWLEVEGVPIRAWDNQVFNQICSKWGEVILIDDIDVSNRLSKRLCIKSTHAHLIFWSIMATLNNVTYTIRVRELCSWTPTFVAPDNESNEEKFIGKYDKNEEESIEENDIESAADTMVDAEIEDFVKDQEIGEKAQETNHASPKPDGPNEKPFDSDPFELDHLIKKSGKPQKPCHSETPEYPPGFSTILKGDHAISDSIHNLSDGGQIKKPGFSMLERLEDTIRVGLALGLNMEGCEKTLASLITEKGDNVETKMPQVDLWMLRQIWGNVHFDFASTLARGLSGGIICLWNSLVFRKSRIVFNDNYVVIDGLWIPNDVQVKWIVVYAPQSLSNKITLWSTLSNLLDNWDGISVIMGDFNEVRDEGERYGWVFCDRQARFFNEFIADNSLIDIPLGGCNFTWTNKWGTKMSKLDHFLVSKSFYEVFPHGTGLVLEKGIPDHRPILLKESIVDYGLLSGSFTLGWRWMVFMTWWPRLGIMMADTYALKKEHHHRLSTIDSKIDQGCASEADFMTRRDSLSILGDMDRLEAKDYAQKAKIKWALEGDENTSFFHGTLKKKRRQLAIRGILKNGEGIEAPDIVKEEFLMHFRNRFKKPSGPFTVIDSLSFNPLSQTHRDYLELPFSRDEIKKGRLKINVDKSNILGVGISDEEISQMARIIGCGVSKLPFKYLGVLVECNMSRCVNWNAVTHIFTSKLSFWKARLLSVGGCLSLIKAVLCNLPTYFMSIYLMPISIRSKLESMRSKFFRESDRNDSKMSWVKWEKCLSSKKKGGLGIGSIYRLNIGLLFKWIWRFLTRPSDLWARIIRSIYGHNEGVLNDTNRRLKQTTWGSILSSVKRLKDKGIDLISLCSRKLGNGESTRFWEDTCTVLSRIPRGGVESNQFEALKAAIGNVFLTDQSDTWQWTLNVAAGYSVAPARVLVDDTVLEVGLVATRWNRHIPIKVNVFLWRLNLNKLPYRVNLDRKGIEVGSLLCPTCQLDVETVNHIFFICEMAKDLWSLLAKWWELDIPIWANISDWYDWLDDVRVAAKARSILEGVGGLLCGLFGTYGTN